MTNEELIAAIKAALNTEEEGENLVEVARQAHQGEQQLTAWVRRWNDEHMETAQ